MKQFSAEVLSNRQIADGYFELRFAWAPDAAVPEPGQFISIKSYGTTDLILRRPFAVAGWEERGANASIIYQKRGAATGMLAARAPGEQLDVIGPLGNRFPEPVGGRALLVGGGVGLGPILYFGNRLAAAGKRPLVVLGFRNAALVPELAERCGFTPLLCTDDGSRGFRGNVVALLRSLPEEELRGGVLYACGPNPMMAGCHALAVERSLSCWVSMEQVMGCGVGACVGCAIPVEGASSYARVCTEGPVFSSGVIKWSSL